VHDYLLYIHGVNVRESSPNMPTYADSLDSALRVGRNPQDVTSIKIYWGNLDDLAETTIKAQWETSKAWSGVWFQNLRTDILLPFIGDAVQYISRAIGAKVVERIYKTASAAFQNREPQQGDQLHLITHSWGTIILLDVLFADRWNDQEAPKEAADQVHKIRKMIFGLEPNPDQGLKLASITTMGCPFSLFSLMDISALPTTPSSSSGHDISDTMIKFFSTLYDDKKKPLPWRNFIHPGDPVAYPVEPLVETMLGGQAYTANVTDVLLKQNGPLKLFGRLFHRSDVSIADASSAHASYWKSKEVSADIKTVISS
jgi:hypothetical protein